MEIFEFLNNKEYFFNSPTIAHTPMILVLLSFSYLFASFVHLSEKMSVF